ncbi:MAG: ABC transporter permease [Proteobacteria bacterium]|nr:ABC transporter permease [Pseudomonadota bacterium]
MDRIWGLIKKEYIHFYRDPVAMSLILYFYTACIILCGYCFFFDAKHMPTVVYDMNRTAASREVIEKFLSTEYFDLDSYAASMEDVKSRLDSGKANVALVIPPEFTRDLAKGRPAYLQFIGDGSDANQAGQGGGFAKRIIGELNRDIIISRLNNRGITVSHVPGIDVKIRALFNQDLKSLYYVVIFHVAIAGLVSGIVLCSTAVVREKERGTIDQILVTPTRSWELLIAKTVAPLTIGLVSSVFSFLVVFWFNVPMRGNPLTFFIFMAFFLISSSGIGIMIGSICNNMLQAILLSLASTFPSLFLSGVITPLENLSPFLQKVSISLPFTHFMIAANSIFQKGNGFDVLWPQALILIGMGAGYLSIGCFLTWRQWRQ